MKKLFFLFCVLPLVAVAGEVTATSVTARQRYPWNGLVDVTVTIQGSADDMAVTECLFAATNSATKAEIPVTHITRNGDDVGSGSVWTRKFIWDAKADVGAVKIDDVALMVDTKPIGVQLWENGPYWAECNVGATKPEEYGYYFWWGDTVGYKRNASNNGWVSVKDETGFFSAARIARRMARITRNYSRMATLTRQAISSPRMMRRRRISVRRGGCRRTRSFRR